MNHMVAINLIAGTTAEWISNPITGRVPQEIMPGREIGKALCIV